ncbi:deoxyguanosinetriphosphate triphosphohydrolase [Desulfosporosinus acididurans]|uniref:Deoxyguanosinetriphosphate triphosphohydrolase n=1 Tax=Desulfosporosinus acididurans TaxID=476652 RepID=A0A0J1IT57_9FIRM|nr:deoxyguanosinetriphosphate triphosphohydrolase [Desulfosporosinus acididurans]
MTKLNFSLRAPGKYVSRKENETRHKYRSDFTRDRDRILYCKAFRRLSSKTQVFVSGFDDHMRNRLTHTLEVSQIARTISQNLKLDQDLTEAIALAHDLGHTPFGHVGERTLNLIMNGCDPLVRDYFSLPGACILLTDVDKGFKHNLQSVRIAMDLESPSTGINDRGLNLTNFTLYGIKSHSKTKWSECKKWSKENDDDKKYCFEFSKFAECLDSEFSLGYFDKYKKFYLAKNSDREAWSFEAFSVAWADEISQRHHDIEDAIEGKLLSHSAALNLVQSNFEKFFSKIDLRNFEDARINKETEFFLPKLSRLIVNFLVSKLLEISTQNIINFAQKNSIKTMEDFDKKYLSLDINDANRVIGLMDLSNLNDDLDKAHKKFQDQLKDIVLNSYNVHRMDGKAQYIIRRLYKAYLANPQQLPDKTIQSLFRECKETNNTHNISDLRNILETKKKHNFAIDEEQGSMDFKASLLRVICDYIAGMTDSFAIKEYENLYG